MSEAKPLIVFSGGLDSSYLLYQELKKGDVHTCYFRASQHADKVDMELKSRRALIPLFETMTGHRVISDTVFELGVVHRTITRWPSGHSHDRNENGPVPDSAWAQMHLWLHGIMHVVDHREHSVVYMGVLGNDDIAYRIGDILQDWQHRSSHVKQNFVPLEFPLLRMEKIRVLTDFPLEAYRHIWVCELPERKYEEPDPPVPEIITIEESKDSHYIPRKYELCICDECHACDDHAQAVWLWERRANRRYTTKGTTFKQAVEEAEKKCADIAEFKASLPEDKQKELSYEALWDMLCQQRNNERYAAQGGSAGENCAEEVCEKEQTETAPVV